MSRPDQLAPLIANATSNVRTEPTRPGAVEYQDAEGRFVSGCPKCRGRGQIYSNRTGRPLGQCFQCKGKGKLAFAQPAAQRAANRASAARSAARRQEDNVAAFIASNPNEWAWLQANQNWAVAREIVEKVRKYGELREGQMGIIRRGIDRDVARVVARQEAIANAPTADAAGVERLKAAFDHAAARAAEKGRKFLPRLTIGGITISPAKANSANAGGLYVKRDGEYMGKVVQNKFIAQQVCDDETKATILRFIADPQREARAYGLQYKYCCICNRTLTVEESMDRGMGPVCAANFGWA